MKKFTFIVNVTRIFNSLNILNKIGFVCALITPFLLWIFLVIGVLVSWPEFSDVEQLVMLAVIVVGVSGILSLLEPLFKKH